MNSRPRQRSTGAEMDLATGLWFGAAWSGTGRDHAPSFTFPASCRDNNLSARFEHVGCSPLMHREVGFLGTPLPGCRCNTAQPARSSQYPACCHNLAESLTLPNLTRFTHGTTHSPDQAELWSEYGCKEAMFTSS